MARTGFITFEGGEGAGKSTQARLLAAKLIARGHRVTLTREPGGSPGAEIIRQLLVTGETGRWTPLGETLLHFAAREDHLVRTIRPALARGEWVICDRFLDSTFAYQGVAQGLSRKIISALGEMVVGDDMPALTLILDMPAETGLQRTRQRNGGAVKVGGEDRYERMGMSFHETLRNAFLTIAADDPQRCVVIDGAGDEETVAKQIWNIVETRFDP